MRLAIIHFCLYYGSSLKRAERGCCSLVPRPCAFVACSAKFAERMYSVQIS